MKVFAIQNDEGLFWNPTYHGKWNRLPKIYPAKRFASLAVSNFPKNWIFRVVETEIGEWKELDQ